jgi:predicted glycoside hydrolase/deacetylase ChbG (UPF0249 family)
VAGLLIVNADDWGGTAAATDRIAECFAAGAITSASAMMWMDDADRAASLDSRQRPPLGLHLNVVQPFDGPDVPPAVRDRQARVCDALTRSSRFRRAGFDPRLLAIVRRCVGDQLQRFAELYGRRPTHIDGHEHGHLQPTVLAVLPRDLPIRAPKDVRPPGALPVRLAREARRRLLRARFRTPRAMYAIENVHPRLGGTGWEAVVERARREPVEVMVHPEHDGERELLLSPGWGADVAGLSLGTFADL